MGIPLVNISEGCCNLSDYNIIDGDSLDNTGSTCDIVIECLDKYILVEEKSLLLGFFDLCLKEKSLNLENYKFNDNGTTYLKISDVISIICLVPPTYG